MLARTVIRSVIRCNRNFVRGFSLPKDTIPNPKDTIPKETNPNDKYDMILAELDEIKDKQEWIIVLSTPIWIYTMATCIGTLIGFK